MDTTIDIEEEVIELLLGENSIRVKLRMKDNIDEDFHTLMADLDLLIINLIPQKYYM